MTDKHCKYYDHGNPDFQIIQLITIYLAYQSSPHHWMVYHNDLIY